MTHTDAVLVTLSAMTDEAARLLRQREGLQVEANSVRVVRDERFNENMAAVFAVLSGQGLRVQDVLSGHRNLEALFLSLTSRRLRDDEEQNG